MIEYTNDYAKIETIPCEKEELEDMLEEFIKCGFMSEDIIIQVVSKEEFTRLNTFLSFENEAFRIHYNNRSGINQIDILQINKEVFCEKVEYKKRLAECAMKIIYGIYDTSFLWFLFGEHNLERFLEWYKSSKSKAKKNLFFTYDEENVYVLNAPENSVLDFGLKIPGLKLHKNASKK